MREGLCVCVFVWEYPAAVKVKTLLCVSSHNNMLVGDLNWIKMVNLLEVVAYLDLIPHILSMLFHKYSVEQPMWLHPPLFAQLF